MLSGYVKLGNKRVNSKALPQIGETVIDIDRSNPIFGNPYVTSNKTNEERIKVVNLYETHYNDRIERINHTIELAERVLNGERIRLMCWCFPDKICHGEIIIKKVKDYITIKKPDHPFLIDVKFKWMEIFN